MKIPFLSRKPQGKYQHAGIAVVISSDGVHFSQIRFVAGRPKVDAYGYYPIPGGKNSPVTSSSLEKFRKELKAKDTHYSLVLAPGEYQLLQVDAPNVPEDELKSAVRWSIKDLLGYHVDDAVVDVLKIPGLQDRKNSVYVVATAKALVERRSELFEKAHMKLRIIDIPEMAQRNIASLFEEQDRSLALLAFDDRGALLTFTSGGELYLSRRMEITSGQLMDADESLRQQHIDRLELEVQRSIDGFDRQYSQRPLKRLLVSAPSGAGITGLLGRGLDLPVEQLDLTEAMDLDGIPSLANEDMRVFAMHALGAALRREDA